VRVAQSGRKKGPHQAPKTREKPEKSVNTEPHKTRRRTKRWKAIKEAAKLKKGESGGALNRLVNWKVRPDRTILNKKGIGERRIHEPSKSITHVKKNMKKEDIGFL